MSTVLSLNKPPKNNKKVKEAEKLKMKYLMDEDMQIVMTLESLKSEMDHIHNTMNQLTEPILIDSCIYELKAIQIKYQYFLCECKKRGLVADMPYRSMITTKNETPVL